MKRLALLLGVSLLFLLIGQADAYTQDLYYYNTTTAADFNMTVYANVSSDLENCSTTLELYANVLGGSGKALDFFLYENGTQIGSTVLYSSDENATCMFLKSGTVGSGVINATARVLNLGSPVTTTLFLEMHTACGLVSNATIFVFDQTGTTFDSIGRNMYNQRFTFNNTLPIDDAQDVVAAWSNLTPSHCGITNKKIPALEQLTAGQAVISFIPFNSGVGTVNITGYGSSNALSAVHMGILNPSTNGVTVLYIASGGAGINIDSQLTLIPATNYVAWVSNYLASSSGGFNPPILNITLTDYVANYSCSASNCTNGTRTLSCIDLGGLAPDTITGQPCLPQAEQIFLGFEESYPVTLGRCVPGIGCSLSLVLENITKGYPDNPRWLISDFVPAIANYNVYFAKMTSEDKSNLKLNGTIQRIGQPPMILSDIPYGSQSLKMWYIPPSPPEQLLENTSCGSLTIGQYPYSSLLGINNSFFVQFNFTFPSDLMALDFDVKRCPEPVKQWDNCGFIVTVQPEACFGNQGNCSVAPRGDYYVSLYDITAGAFVITLTENAPGLWERKDFDLAGNIQYGHEYLLQFGLNPSDELSNQAQCVYFDNVLLINRESPVQCTTSNACVGAERHMQQMINGVCVTTIQQNDSACVAQQQQQAVSGNQSIFQPISSVSGAVVNVTTGETLAQSWQASGFGFALVFLTPIFWIMLIIAVVMMIGAYVTKHMEIGMGAGLVILIAFTFALPELIVITIMLIVITAYIVGRAVVKAASGGE